MLRHPPSLIQNDTQPSSYIRPSVGSATAECETIPATTSDSDVRNSDCAFPPSCSQIFILWETFRQNVAPVVNIFHLPSTKQTFMNAAMAPDLVHRDTKPLMFSVYYAAVASMTDDICIQNMENARSTLLLHYHCATQQALIKANIFHTQNIQVLQAAVLLWTCMQNQDDRGYIWSMVSLLFRVAQAMGMHRDGGTMLDLTPIEVEVRRRIWWQICFLDVRLSKINDREPLQYRILFDTQIPLNINDEDIPADSTTPAVERAEATEMTFCRMRCHLIAAAQEMSLLGRGTGAEARETSKPFPSRQAERILHNFRGSLERSHIRQYNSFIPL
ncbi:C6 transcription factor [Penicillium brevicompactum]|uniref:C6 transcription factor n=1 Tax=Penicillium brevicompactum TaxID=5074 RepID=UPI0025421C88|nr:C6 transcription factor [Penicillium brevicompactum]KAJ5326287.1 C6 transcription factor [Penicillium brevicompactum]